MLGGFGLSDCGGVGFDETKISKLESESSSSEITIALLAEEGKFWAVFWGPGLTVGEIV